MAKLISDRSDAKYIFKDWQAGSLRAVEELSVGTYVVALPRVVRDLRWCPIITLDATEHARFTYIHPHVLFMPFFCYESKHYHYRYCG